jgi:hypothetical protein
MFTKISLEPILLGIVGPWPILIPVIILIIFIIVYRKNKKVLLTVLGAILIIIGLVIHNSIDDSYLSQTEETFSDKNSQQLALIKAISIICLVIGGTMELIGIVLIIKSTSEKVEPLNKSISREQVTNNDLILQIEKLGKLREQGLITDEEFQNQKMKNLGDK